MAKEWEASHPGELSADEAEFLRCSRNAQQQREASELEAARALADAQKERAEQAEKAQRLEKERAQEAEKRAKEQKESANKLRRRALAAAGAAVVALLLLAVSVLMWRAAQEQAKIANDQLDQRLVAESRRLAAESSSALTKYPQRSLLLAVEAAKVQQSLPGLLGSCCVRTEKLLIHHPHFWTVWIIAFLIPFGVARTRT